MHGGGGRPGGRGVRRYPEDTLIFSADGKRVAYRAWKRDKCLVVVDGEAGAEYDAIAEGSPVFSADGKRVAYRTGRA